MSKRPGDTLLTFLQHVIGGRHLPFLLCRSNITLQPVPPGAPDLFRRCPGPSADRRHSARPCGRHRRARRDGASDCRTVRGPPGGARGCRVIASRGASIRTESRSGSWTSRSPSWTDCQGSPRAQEAAIAFDDADAADDVVQELVAGAEELRARRSSRNIAG